MKKTSVVLASVIVLMLLIQSATFSTQTSVPANACSTGKYPVSNVVSRGIQTVFGMNFMVRHIAQSIIKKQIASQIDKGKIKVNLKSYSAGDLIAGKIKNFTITGQNIETDGIFISNIKAESLCDFTWFDYKSKPAVIKSPLYVKYSADVTKEDFKKIFASETVKKSMTGIKIKVGFINFGEVDFANITPDILNRKITMKANLVYKKKPLSFNFPINMETSLKVKDDKIMLTNLKFPANSLSDEFRFITNFIELNNIIILDLKTLEKDGSDININKVNIVNDKISVEGTVWLPQNTQMQ